MVKTKKTIQTIYGDYATEGFVKGLRNVAIVAQGLAKLHRTDSVKKDIDSIETNHSVEAVEFWSDIETQCREFLR